MTDDFLPVVKLQRTATRDSLMLRRVR
jgi:hypothetical protein